ncbi:hypothetical protein [Clostridium akagii]|uniref:hypothetical protein n=1 Tax=Clostridium akagii TaxID=91623 RepID=UPI000478C68F|nr:hypothetical protein [Clostridium akagii]
MLRVIVAGKEAILTEGTLKGKIGMVVACDLLKDEVTLVLDEHYTIVTKTINIQQNYIENLEKALRTIKTDLSSIDEPTEFDSYINSDITIINEVLGE